MSCVRSRTRLGDESGLTIVELIIYVVFSVIVATLVTSMFINMVVSQNQTTSMTHATTRGQAIAQGIERALRNASAVTITTDPSGNLVLSVLTTLDEPCQAWRVTSTGAIDAATGPGFSRWGEQVHSVEAIDSAPYFAWEGGRVRYSYAVTTEGRPVNFSGAILPRGSGGSLEAECS